MKKYRKGYHLVESFFDAFFIANSGSSVHAKGEQSLMDLEKYLVAQEEPKGPEDDDEPGE